MSVLSWVFPRNVIDERNSYAHVFAPIRGIPGKRVSRCTLPERSTGLSGNRNEHRITVISGIGIEIRREGRFHELLPTCASGQFGMLVGLEFGVGFCI